MREVYLFGIFVARRLVALVITVMIGVYLTIVVANMGGQVDELRLIQIRADVAEEVRGRPRYRARRNARR
jgi:peptide/nickel transport system permease protein